ncbi:MAG: sugar phosphate isomerase/epimerase [Chloroflexi bacterium]|nr:sugar phosphate isomerase/epimerase [Chloroflexota bacterium]
MFRCLSPGAVGINSTLEEGLGLARRFGFVGLEVSMADIARRAEEASMDSVKKLFLDAGVCPGAWGLPVDWRAEEGAFQADLVKLDRLAAAGQALGCTRTATWIMPSSDDLPFAENFAFHRDRFSRIASVLAQHGCSVGLEFIGPATLRRGRKYEFIYTVGGMLELAAACGPNVGLLLDCWHWYTSGGTKEDLEKLKPEQVVYVHVNDAPAGVALDEQVDNVRAMPGETGVINIAAFLQTLQKIGYEGPVTPEPFNAALKGLPCEEAARITGESMAKIWQLAGLK